MSNTISQADISDLLADITANSPENKNSTEKLSFDFKLDFKYKNKISPLDRNEIKDIISNIIINYKIKLMEIKRTDNILCKNIKTSLIPDYNLMEKSDTEISTQEYSLDGEQVFISTSVSLINSILDRNFQKESDPVSEYAAKLYIFDVLKSYLNQFLSKKHLALEEIPNQSSYIKSKTENDLFLTFEAILEYNKKLTSFSIAFSSEACLKLLGKKQPEITLHSNDYYKKRNGYVVISGTNLSAEEIQNLQDDSIINFPMPQMEDNIYDLVLNNKLVAKGKCGTYDYCELYTTFEATELIPTLSQPDYFSGEKNTFLIFATANSHEARNALTKTSPKILLDTEINSATLLLMCNKELIATAIVTEVHNALTAKIKLLNTK